MYHIRKILHNLKDLNFAGLAKTSRSDFMLSRLKKEDGQMLVFTAMGMAVLILSAALAIDVSYLITARNQLRTAVDASALAGASGLPIDQNTAAARAIALSGSNAIMGNSLSLNRNEISFPNYKTISITASRTVPLFFSRIMGRNTATIVATATSQCGNRDIMLVFDRSGSMDDDTVNPLNPQPINTAKSAAYYFIDLIQANSFAVDRIGLVSYSDNASLDRSLDRQFTQMKSTIATYVADGNTNIGEGINKAMNCLNSNSPANTRKTIVLFSDGMANRPGSGMPTNPQAINYAVTKAKSAKSSKIVIYTVSLGNETDPDTMRQIASVTGGLYYYAPTAADLYAVYLDISKRIPVRLAS
jgi:Mg-chelatase subunit ChlD